MSIDIDAIWCPTCGIEWATHGDRGCYRYPPGTPAGPDPDRAEMLLAVALGRYELSRGEEPQCTEHPCWLCAACALDGFDMEDGFRYLPEPCDEDPDAYAAGAALAMALEDA